MPEAKKRERLNTFIQPENPVLGSRVPKTDGLPLPIFSA
jgi:hypothetical protein